MAKTQIIQLVAGITGTRDGEDWPKAGSIVELPEDEASSLVRNFNAVPYEGDEKPVEFARASRAGIETRVK